MKIFRHRFVFLLLTTILALVPMASFSQSGPPPIPPFPYLDSYGFEDTNWLSEYGYPPLAFSNLVSVSMWGGNALLLDTTNAVPAYLQYRVVETNGFTNVAFASGALEYVFINTWASADTNQGGTGPGALGYLLGAGDFSSGSSNGLWRVYVDSAGTNLYFGGVSNSTTNIFASTPISWPSNSIHLLGIMYDSNSTALYLDGGLSNLGSGVTIVPATNIWSNGFFVGSDSDGYEQGRAVYWDLEFSDSNCFNIVWSNGFVSDFTRSWSYISNGYYGWLSGEGGGFSFFGGFNLPPNPTNAVNTNYTDYTNFWLTVSSVTTNVNVKVVNTLSNVTYQILTNRNLSTTNWGVWQTFVASNSITSAPSIGVSSNPMYFNARMVWSTCTNYSPALPDWWTMLYFNSTACVNPASNPAGDGIDNWDKYLLGLNPNIAYASPLMISPPGGNYVSTPTVTIFSLSGASIKYTTNGTVPSATNGISIASGVPITNLPNTNFTLKAWESGLVSNVPAVATYNLIPGTPEFSLSNGIYAAGTTLQISCVTTNATVRYTTNGVDPTTSSTQILPTATITLNTNITIKTAAWLGTNVSPVAQANYIIEPLATLSPPTNDNFTNATVLSGSAGTFTGTTLNATLESFEINNPGEFIYENDFENSIWYRWTAPSNGVVLFNSYEIENYLSFYTFPSGFSSNPSNLVAVPADQFYSTFVSYTASVTNGVTYYFSVATFAEGSFNGSWQYVAPTPTPFVIPDSGTYLTSKLVTISDSDTDAVIYYTTNGSSPTTNSSIVHEGNTVLIYQTTTLKLMAFDPLLEESAIKTATYTINSSSTNPTLTATAPLLSPTNVVFTNSTTITLTDTNETGATIFYTLDGSLPSLASASVASGGTVTISNSAFFSARSWVTNMNLSTITTSQYAEAGVDTAGDGIPDSSKLIIGVNDILVPSANLVNPNPFAHGLNNLQVYENQSVLLADNYSTEGDGIPDWWLVQNGYSVTTPATATGANGQTLLLDYTSGSNPNDPNSQPGLAPPIDFHMVHGPTNSMIMVLDTVRPGMASYFLTCVNTDQGLPGMMEEFPAAQSIDDPSNGLGRYFQLTNQLAPGMWLFTMRGVNSNGITNTVSSNTFLRNQDSEGSPTYFTEYNTWSRYSGVPVPVVGYTNDNGIKDSLFEQILRAESDVWNDAPGYPAAEPLLYDVNVNSLNTEPSWGTLTFQDSTNFGNPYYLPTGLASYFTSICATPDVPLNCDAYFTNHYGVGGFPNTELAPLQPDYDANNGDYYLEMATNIFNPAGLAYQSVTYELSGSTHTLTPGQSNVVPSSDFTFEAALDTETPSLQAVNYYFDGRQYPVWGGQFDYISSPPDYAARYSGNTGDGWIIDGAFDFGVLPVSMTNAVIVGQVGRPINLQAWEEVIAVRPGGTPITNQTYFIDLDFAQAYLCTTTNGDVPRTSQTNYNGKFTINTNAAVKTGILSPNLNYPQNVSETYYPWRSADFTPTQPGKVIITTMPDDNGDYGEVTIYVIDMQVDKDHNGVMDNRDLTSIGSPMQFWINNNIDRFVPDSDDSINYDDDVPSTDAASDSPGTPGVPTPDYNYVDRYGMPEIPNMRDLEDYARLWIPGLSNLMDSLPTNFGATLQWRNGTGAAIRLFKAAESNGGTNYLFDLLTSGQQLDSEDFPCYGYVSPSQTISLNQAFNSIIPAPGDHFIFCGAGVGNDELLLQVTNQYGGVVGEASVFLNLQDIKNMYERWSVGEYPQTPSLIATNCGDDGIASFKYSYNPRVDSTTPYILYVHGWNMSTWDKDRFAECAFKRLYWQGYQGRFGVFRWPTDYNFTATFIDAIFQAHNYDSSEDTAWQSASGLLNRLVSLNIQYPEQVYLVAHSMGNVVAGQALWLGGSTNIVNTYVASQAAVPAHMYDSNIDTPFLIDFTHSNPNIPGIVQLASYGPTTPNIYNSRLAGNNGAVQRRINFYNVNDYALSPDSWCFDQELKPDTFGVAYYTYVGSTNDPSPWNHFAYVSSAGSSTLDIVSNITDLYDVYAYAAEPRSDALGATPAISGFTQNVDLDFVWPVDTMNSVHPYSEHFYHSAEFRGDYWQQQNYWNTILGPDGFNLK